jgi:hypothetical protein
MALGTLASRLVRLEQTVAQRHNTSLNPQASLDGLDPQWVADEIARSSVDAIHFIDQYYRVESDTGEGVVPFRLWDFQVEVLGQWLEYGDGGTRCLARVSRGVHDQQHTDQPLRPPLDRAGPRSQRRHSAMHPGLCAHPPALAHRA